MTCESLGQNSQKNSEINVI
uniref:Uncharacterized protein n=1 Tax=Rhizophora mucronata TaxID=61149 RepID=A0A2P2PY85_RHIMU